MVERKRKPLLIAANLIGVGLATVGVAACDPPARSRDSVSTRTYLHARSTLERAYEANLGASRANIAAFVANVRNTCTGALRNAPAEPLVIKLRDGEVSASSRESVLVEIAKALEAALYGPRRAARQRFID